MTLKTTAAALLLAGLTGLSPAGQEQTRRLYVSALDSSEVAVANLGPDDLTVKEGGKLRPILRVEPAVAKMSIAILVDDNGTGIFRFGVGRFIQSLLGRAEFSISVVRGQSMKLVDFTDDTRELSEAVAQLTAHPSTNDGNQLLDGITGSSLDMAKRKAGRPIIIALTVGGDDVTPMQPDDALEDLRKSGAHCVVRCSRRRCGRWRPRRAPPTCSKAMRSARCSATGRRDRAATARTSRRWPASIRGWRGSPTSSSSNTWWSTRCRGRSRPRRSPSR